MVRSIRAMVLSAMAVFGMACVAVAETPGPKVGEEAKDFELGVLGGKTAKLSDLAKDGPVVLVVLRGYPGYQCPICSRQVKELVGKASDFKTAGAKVVFVYPGPSDKLQEHAKEFTKGQEFPENFTFLIDPDYTFTNAYGLRWDARAETAYPSTFVMNKDRKVTFAKVSTTHGGRTTAAEVVKAATAAK